MKEWIRRDWLRLCAFVRWLLDQFRQFTPQPPTVDARITPQRVVIGRVERPLVGRHSQRLWESRGWTRTEKNGETWYDGRFRVNDGSGRHRLFKGCLVEAAGNITTYIADLPPEVKRHPKGPCFQLSKAPWFRLHWVRPPEHVDHAIAYTERILCEALSLRRG